MMKKNRMYILIPLAIIAMGGIIGLTIFLVQDFQGQHYLKQGMNRLAGLQLTGILNKYILWASFLAGISLILYFCISLLLKHVKPEKKYPWLDSFARWFTGKGKLINITAAIFVGFIIILNLWVSISKKTKVAPSPNVIIVVSDALRRDHLGCYGYEKTTTPYLDAFARESSIFKNAYAQSPSTKPSIASLFTSKYPSQHKAIYNENSLNPEFLTLAEVLKEHRYVTAAFNENPMIELRFNYNQGFDQWNTNDKRHKFTLASMKDFDDKIMTWLDTNYENPFFLYIHFIDPHNPYRAPMESTTQEKNENSTLGRMTEGKKLLKLKNGILIGLFEGIDQLISLYDEEIKYVDSRFGQLMDKINQLGIMNNSMIIFLADHGEGFLDHGFFYHSYSVNAELINIPLLVHFPGGMKEVLPDVPVQQVDIFPTIMDVIGIEDDSFSFEGKSIFKKRPPEAIIFSEHLRKGYGKGMQQCVIKKNWKLIYSLETQTFNLYNLKLDPMEKTDRSKEFPSIAKQLKNELYTWHQRMLKNSSKAQKAHIDKELYRKMYSLGYIDK